MAREPEASLPHDLAKSLIEGDFGPVESFFERNRVAAPALSWDPKPGEMASTAFDFLIGFWQYSRGDNRWPAEDMIDPVGLRPALGNLLVCEPVEAASDFRIRLYGSRLALEMGRDLTGTNISDFEPGSYITVFYLACYRAVVLRGEPLFSRHAPSAGSFASDIRRLLLPFGPSESVTRIVTGVDSVRRRPLGRPTWTRRG